jgi:hypothetical protein
MLYRKLLAGDVGLKVEDQIQAGIWGKYLLRLIL